MRRATNWLGDFAFDGGAVRVRKTGAAERIDMGLVREVAIWLVFYLCLRVRAAWNGRSGGRLVLGFAPDLPRPWYLIRAACIRADIAVTDDPAAADCIVAFEDATWCVPPPSSAERPWLNRDCTDISKSHVATVFERVAGYPLALDPTAFVGRAVEKSEVNARHDGCVVDCPCVPRAGYVYQKLIDTARDGHVADLRTPCVGGVPVVVWEKRRHAGDLFSPRNVAVVARDPAEVYSRGELAMIGRFCAAVGLDWGGLDILRDRHDGRIYIVDVNKTDAGPPIDLSLRDKLRSTALLGAALRGLVGQRRGRAMPSD